MIELIKFAYTKLSLFYSTLSSKATESKQTMSMQKLEEEEYGTEDAIDQSIISSVSAKKVQQTEREEEKKKKMCNRNQTRCIE